MSAKKKKSLENPDSIFFFAKFNDAMESSDGNTNGVADTDKLYELPIFREGSFKHYWYGDLDFDLSYLNKIVRNHTSKVVGTDIAFDRDHMPQEGALAWVVPNGLSIKPVSLPDGRVMNVLHALVNFTVEGVEKILQKKMFKYFSAEISEDFSTREKEEMVDGTAVVKSYGPTLIGGGFTNRPFISHLGAVFNRHHLQEGELGDMGKVIDVAVDYLGEDKDIEYAFASYRFSDKAEDTQQAAVVETTPDVSCVKKDEVENQSKVIEDEPVQFGLTKAGDTMKFSDFITKMAAIKDNKERYEFAVSTQGFSDAGEEMVRQNILAAEERAYNSHRLAEEATREAVAFKTQVERLGEENITLSRRVLEANETSYQNRVNAFSTGLLNDGHFPGVVNEVKDILLAVTAEERKFSFSVGGDDKADLMSVFSKVFSKIPKEYKVPEPSDVLETIPEGEQQDATPAEPAQLSLSDMKAEAFRQLYNQEPSADLIDHLRDDGSVDLSKIF